MKRLISSFLIISIIFPTISRAQHVVVPTEIPLICPVVEGQPAPFQGILFNKPAAAKIAIDYKYAEENTRIEIEKAVKDSEVKKDKIISDVKSTCKADKEELIAKNTELSGVLDLKDKEISSLKKQLEDSPNRTTWFGMGFAGGLIFTIVTAFAVGQIVR